MSEYWVSQAKFHCKYCKVWIADNKPSRALHDSGLTHKRNIEVFHKKKREDSLHGAQSERDLQKTLADIERSAKEALANDRLESAGLFHMNASLPIPRPPPLYSSSSSSMGPPPTEFNIQQGNSSSNRFDPPLTSDIGAKSLSSSAIDAISQNLREDKSGVYTVRGVTYLEGQYHEDRLVTGTACEVFVETVDDWLSASILACKEISVPNTDVRLRRYKVSFMLEMPSGGEKEVVDEDVKSDRLRLRLDRSREAVTDEGTIVAVKPLVESTGLGAWQTVSVRIVTEAEEEAERRACEAEAKEEESNAANVVTRKALQDHTNEEADSALAAFDPYNTGLYKGVQIGKEIIETDIGNISKGEKVDFKKRKGGGAAATSGSVRIFRRKVGGDV